MRCLWLTRVDPRSADAGDLIYSSGLIASISEAGVDVTVLTTEGAERVDGADSVDWSLVKRPRSEIGGRLAYKSLLSRLPNVAVQYRTKHFQYALEAHLLQDWDVVVVDHLAMGWAWDRLLTYARRHFGTTLVFVAHQCEGELRRQMARNFSGNPARKAGLYLDAEKAYRLEHKIVRTTPLLSVIAQQDLAGFGANGKGVVLTPGYSGPRLEAREITAETPRRVLLFGSGIWFAKQMNILEFLEAADDLFHDMGIELCIVGNIAEGVRNRRPWRATRFLGFVDDPVPVFRDSRIGVVPERTGGGFKLKSLDYVFNRLPIVAIRGSIGGLPLSEGEDYIACTTMSDLVIEVMSVIDDLPRLNRLHQAAYEKCRDAFDWRDRGRAFVEAVRSEGHEHQKSHG